jgi:hypothetical protein
MPGHSKRSPSLRFLYEPLLTPINATCPAHLSFLTWPTKWYLLRSTEHKAPCYAVFSTPLLPHPSWAQNILLSTLFSKTLSLLSSLNLYRILRVFLSQDTSYRNARRYACRGLHPHDTHIVLPSSHIIAHIYKSFRRLLKHSYEGQRNYLRFL